MNISSLYNSILANTNQISYESLASANIPTINKTDSTILPSENSSIEGISSFKDIISNEIEKLNNTQVKADKLTQDFITGEVEDLHSVMIATEEARIALELAVQVRNKCVEAYKEINNMQL